MITNGPNSGARGVAFSQTMEATRMLGTRPSKFKPSLLRPPLWQRLSWLFSANGKAHRRLWKAKYSPRNAAALERLKQTLSDRLKARPKDAASRTVIGDILMFLTWRSLQLRDDDDARYWMGELDEHCANSRERIALRWELLRRLLEANNRPLYVDQACLFLADPLLTLDDHGIAILEIVHVVYEQI